MNAMNAVSILVHTPFGGECEVDGRCEVEMTSLKIPEAGHWSLSLSTAPCYSTKLVVTDPGRSLATDCFSPSWPAGTGNGPFSASGNLGLPVFWSQSIFCVRMVR